MAKHKVTARYLEAPTTAATVRLNNLLMRACGHTPAQGEAATAAGSHQEMPVARLGATQVMHQSLCYAQGNCMPGRHADLTVCVVLCHSWRLPAKRAVHQDLHHEDGAVCCSTVCVDPNSWQAVTSSTPVTLAYSRAAHNMAQALSQSSSLTASLSSVGSL